MKRGYKLLFFFAYVLLMLWLLLGQRIGQDNEVGLQLQPLLTLRRFFRLLIHTADPALRWQAWKNLAGNVIMFVPLGFFVPWIWPVWRRFWRHILLMLGSIVLVELMQLVTGLGFCDVDDLILNLPGTALGYLLWRWISKTRPA